MKPLEFLPHINQYVTHLQIKAKWNHTHHALTQKFSLQFQTRSKQNPARRRSGQSQDCRPHEPQKLRPLPVGHLEGLRWSATNHARSPMPSKSLADRSSCSTAEARRTYSFAVLLARSLRSHNATWYVVTYPSALHFWVLNWRQLISSF